MRKPKQFARSFCEAINQIIETSLKLGRGLSKEKGRNEEQGKK